LAGGALLLIVAGFTRVGVAALLGAGQTRLPELVLNVLAYFLLGFVLLGHAQFTSLHTLWRVNKIATGPWLARRWVRYSLVFVALATLLAFVLPTGYTVSLLAVLEYVLLLVSFLFTFLFALLVMPIARLLSSGETGDAPALPSLPRPPSVPADPSGPSPDWFEVARSLVFWIVVVGVVVYVVRSYLRDHPGIWRALSSFSPFRALGRLLAGLWRLLAGAADGVGRRITRTLSGRRRTGTPSQAGRPRFLRLGALSPRDRVLYYYLSILRRAGNRGLPRHPSQTPFEYDGTLAPHLPDARQELASLTRAFVEARYSRHPVGRKEEKEIRRRWKQVRAALRALGQRKNETDQH
jgi:hypothetical protein